MFGDGKPARGRTIILILLKEETGKVGLMVFNTTFNNISAISWLSVILMEETGVP